MCSPKLAGHSASNPRLSPPPPPRAALPPALAIDFTSPPPGAISSKAEQPPTVKPALSISKPTAGSGGGDFNIEEAAATALMELNSRASRSSPTTVGADADDARPPPAGTAHGLAPFANAGHVEAGGTLPPEPLDPGCYAMGADGVEDNGLEGENRLLSGNDSGTCRGSGSGGGSAPLTPSGRKRPKEVDLLNSFRFER
jgi:hypothetical protein